MQTKIYYNTTVASVLVPALGDTPIAPNSQISITTQYPPQIVLENYPGVVEVTAMSPEDQATFYASQATSDSDPSDDTQTDEGVQS